MEKKNEVPVNGTEKGFLQEIEPMADAIQEVARRYKEEGKEATVILLAEADDRHTAMFHGTGGDLRFLLFECFTVDKRLEKLYMDTARVIALRGTVDNLGNLEKEEKGGRRVEMAIPAKPGLPN